jgi:UDP-glucose 4-epimerase
MTRVGVTGATGFIGGALLPHLAAGGFDLCPVDDATGPMQVDHVEWPVQARDFRSEDALRLLTECDVVVHLGAVSGVMACAEDPAGSARINVEGTQRLADACAAKGVPLAFASSLAVVGVPKQLPVTEDTPARPTHEYARQKAAAEAIVHGLARSGKAPSAVLRMSNVYGGYLVGNRRVAKGNVLQLFAGQAAQGRLTVNAPGTQRRDFVHLEDVLAHWGATVRWLLADPPSSGASTFNVASGESYSVLEIADKVARRWTALHPESVPPKIDVVPNPREGVELVEPEFSVSRALTEQRLGLKCQRTVDGSLDELLASTRDPRR